MGDTVPQTVSRRRTPVSLNSDRNFDDLAHRFATNVYGSQKGDVRLAVIQRDMAVHLGIDLRATAAVQTRDNQRVLRVLDAGGGQGQIGLRLAALGHQVVICDISERMLSLAREAAAQENLSSVCFIHDSIQSMAAQVETRESAPFDLVICHAVLEWVIDQEGLLAQLASLLHDDGYLSLTFYHRHGLVMKNLLRGNRPDLLDGIYAPNPGSLTPTRPLDPQQVFAWLAKGSWRQLCHSGIRVFSDYLLTEQGRAMPKDELLAAELALSQREPYRSLGRYQHLLLQRFCSPS
jgi:S-adenosylmethionine-dependent methyltransferase